MTRTPILLNPSDRLVKGNLPHASVVCEERFQDVIRSQRQERPLVNRHTTHLTDHGLWIELHPLAGPSNGCRDKALVVLGQVDERAFCDHLLDAVHRLAGSASGPPVEDREGQARGQDGGHGARSGHASPKKCSGECVSTPPVMVVWQSLRYELQYGVLDKSRFSFRPKVSCHHHGALAAAVRLSIHRLILIDTSLLKWISQSL